MAPKHDLRGGNASEDSFVMSNNILTASMNRCFLAVGHQRVREGGNESVGFYKNSVRLVYHRLTGVVFEEQQT